jgi:osmoprotectant transport system ATP-binding protein
MIALDHVSKSYGGAPVIDDVSLTIEAGSFCVMLGPSGCGKSTVLRMINAMVAPDSGAISVRGVPLAQQDPDVLRRAIGYVIQSVGLFPHWRVRENILAVPRLLRWSAARQARRLDEIVALVGIDPALLTRLPRELSGGQQQRIGVARALAGDPDIILMDEPFAALDPVSRTALQAQMREVHAKSGKTIVFVTHDIEEALHLATRILVLNKGRIVQSAAPLDLMLKPVDDFVRDFIGDRTRHLRALDITPIGDRVRRTYAKAEPVLPADSSLQAALALMLETGLRRVGVRDAAGEWVGVLDLADIVPPVE